MLPLAVVVAFADGFWTSSLRVAVGAIERAQTPFLSWLRDSTLLLPVFVLAVLGVLVLAARRFGPDVRRPGPVIATAVLVAVAATVAGVATAAGSAAYDYHLQVGQLASMSSMDGSCVGDCLANQRDATWALHLRALGVGAALMLVTNLVVVAWVVALRGGRLRLRSERVAARPRTTGQRDVRVLVVAGLVGSAAVHAAVIPEHLAEWSLAGLFFVALTAAELLVAVLVLWRVPATAGLVALVSVGPLLLWGWSRSVGLPFGPEPFEAEAVGLADCAACLLELATLVGAVLLAWTPRRFRRTSRSAHPVRLGVVALVAVTAVGLGGTGLAVMHGFTAVDTESMHG